MSETTILTEEALDKTRCQIQAAFPDNRVEIDGKRIVITSTTESFLPVEVRKVEGLCAMNHMCYIINASVKCGLQFILF